MFEITNATIADTDEILALYRTMLYGAAGWNENYPSEETIDYDLQRDSLFVMKNDEGQIIATITIDLDEEVEKLDCWSDELTPGGELSRLCVRADMQGQGIAKKMMLHAFSVLKKRGKKSVHILVKQGHAVALAAYTPLGFVTVGECELFDKKFVCMEMQL